MVTVNVGSLISRGGGGGNAVPLWGGGDGEKGPRVGGEGVGTWMPVGTYN